MVIVPTIRNTGSHFVLKMLGAKEPWRHNGVLTWRTLGREPGSIVFDHVFPHQRKLYLPLIADPENITIVPLRHPYLTEKSWNDRGHDTDDLIPMWEVMIHDIAPLNPNFLPLDVPNRKAWLSELNSRTGLSLRTDWLPAGSKQGNSAKRHTDVSPSPRFVEFVEAHRAFLSRFYPQ